MSNNRALWRTCLRSLLICICFQYVQCARTDNRATTVTGMVRELEQPHDPSAMGEGRARGREARDWFSFKKATVTWRPGHTGAAAALAVARHKGATVCKVGFDGRPTASNLNSMSLPTWLLVDMDKQTSRGPSLCWAVQLVLHHRHGSANPISSGIQAFQIAGSLAS